MAIFSRSTAVIVSILLTNVLSWSAGSTETSVILYDFRDGIHGWTSNPRVVNMETTNEGLQFESVGHDPWIESPPVTTMPLGNRVRITVRMKSDGDAGGEIYYGPTFVAERQARFWVKPDGEWHEYSVILPEQEPGTRLRLDPATATGEFTLAWVKAEALLPLTSPDFFPPTPITFDKQYEVLSGPLTLVHNGRDWDGYALNVAGAPMAQGHAESHLGVLIDGEPFQLPLSDATITVSSDEPHTLSITATFTDSGGASWRLERRIEAHTLPGTMRVHTSVMVNEAREVFHLPWLTLFPGLESFGERKTQALLPGVEYLEDEPSSSEADFNAEQAERRIVEDHKLTLPLMALQHDGRYIGVLWNRADKPAAVFDSPDRVFHSQAHLMGLWHPGVGEARLENEFSVFGTLTLEKNSPLVLEMVFMGGEGVSIVPAVQHYIALRGLPDLPEFDGGFEHALRLLAAGWLDSEAHHDGLWRHAVWGAAFPPIRAADGPAYLHWLARYADDAELTSRLRTAAARGLEQLEPPDNYLASVGHVRRPTPTLLFGALETNITRMVEAAHSSIEEFDEQGLRRYHQPDPDRPDYSRTHFADHANGYAAQILEPLLQAAAFSGAPALIEAGLELLDKQTEHYANTVPRGAQTWEMPLHTPDILGSATMIRTYVLGYLLSGNQAFLEEARYWAWTGIPFLYLDHPVDGPVGAYATIAVLGATNWVAPNWVGLPVQWCGLVYRSALHDLAKVDAENGAFWNKVARGITLSGLQQMFPFEDQKQQGLLPDFFHLHEQRSDGPAIIPGTIQTHLPEVYGKTAYYSVERLNDQNMLAHAPGDILPVTTNNDAIAFELVPWTDGPYWVRITGTGPETTATWNTKAPLEVIYDAVFGALNIRVQGSGILTISNF